MNAQQRYTAALNRLAMWRTILTGWQLGTRVKGDPESDAVRDHREATLLLRAELTAVNQLLIERGIYSLDEYMEAVAREADFLSEAMSQKFPGAVATDYGIDLNVEKAREWMKDWRP